MTAAGTRSRRTVQCPLKGCTRRTEITVLAIVSEGDRNCERVRCGCPAGRTWKRVHVHEERE